MTEVLIVGGGLAGLRLADLLAQRGVDFQLVEGRARFGGRILTADLAGGAFDMGPAWFWPGQPRIAALIDALGLHRFDQFATGAAVFEDQTGQVRQAHGFAAMAGSHRIVGGFGALIAALVARLPAERLHLNAPLTGVQRSDGTLHATLANGDRISAQQVMLAIPPRIAAHLPLTPSLTETQQDSLRNIPTWMAGHAKALAVYDTPFWRAAGLSGDGSSRRGPMVEIHDASPADGGPGALFGFIGVPVAARQDTAALRHAVQDQLVRLFGPDAAHPRAVQIKDWALDPLTATAQDHAPLYEHPRYGLPPALRDVWDGTLHFGATETAGQFGGFIEGALEAAEAGADAILARIGASHGH